MNEILKILLETEYVLLLRRRRTRTTTRGKSRFHPRPPPRRKFSFFSSRINEKIVLRVAQKKDMGERKCRKNVISLWWFLLEFDTLNIMHTNSSFFLSPPLSCCVVVVRKMTTLNETTTLMKKATLTTKKRKRKRTRKFDDDVFSLLQKPNANTKRMKMKNDEKEETNTNLLGILVEATDCASPLAQTKTTKKDDESTPPPLPFPSRNPPPLETDKNDDDDDENFELENIQNSKIEEEDQKEAKRRSNAPQPDEEEKEELKEETTFTTTKTSSIIDDEATTTIESIAKAAPKQGLKMFVQWLDALVFDLKSRAATLKRSKKRAQKAFLRMQKEEKKKYVFLETASAKTKGTKKIKKNIKSTRDLKMLRALEDFWGVELSETEKSLERARATLKAHTLMLAVEKDDERAILASAVAFYRTSFGLISERVVVKRE